MSALAGYRVNRRLRRLERCMQAAYRTLVAADMRAVTFSFNDPAYVRLLCARGERAQELRELVGVKTGPASLRVADLTGGVGHLGSVDRILVEQGVKAALKTLDEEGKDVMTIDFSEPLIEPFFGVLARGQAAKELEHSALQSGLISSTPA